MLRTLKIQSSKPLCNILCNSVAKWAFALVTIFAFGGNTAHADEACTKVRQVFFGMNDIAKKGNTKIVPFSKPYEAELASYFDRGCPVKEPFPLPQPGTDMLLGNTSADVVAGGKIKMKLGEPLLR